MEMLIILALTIFALGAFAFVAFQSAQIKKLREENKKEIEKVLSQQKKLTVLSEREAIEKASHIAKNELLEAEKKALEIESKTQENARKIREQLKEQEKVLDEREKKLMERIKLYEQRVDLIEVKEKGIENTKKQIQKQRELLGRKLEEISGLTKNEAINLLKTEVERDQINWIAKKVRESENEIKFKSDMLAKNILIEAMQNASTEYVSETTATTFTIEDESLKGKIIGKEGRNIRTFEKVTGVDLIIDEAPNQITISCFDPIRREVAGLALKKLLSDGRIHPGAIEETVENVKKDLLKVIKKTGEDMAYEAGINNLPNEIIMLLGRFKYRYSYGQNLVKHTLEMVKIGEYLARELGADVYTVKLACILHDIGKVIPEEGKQHHHISGEISRKFFKNNEKLHNAIEAHHYDIESKCIEAEIVRIADAISGARPGARRDSYDEYVKRVRALEDIATKYPSVKEAYAIHAGREIRVILKPDNTTDNDVKVTAQKIAKEIEETQNYPGVVKVVVIRELRGIEEAK